MGSKAQAGRNAYLVLHLNINQPDALSLPVLITYPEFSIAIPFLAVPFQTFQTLRVANSFQVRECRTDPYFPLRFLDPNRDSMELIRVALFESDDFNFVTCRSLGLDVSLDAEDFNNPACG